jgi:hypothetical protein
LDDPRLTTMAEQMTASGDQWRRFAVKAARHCKGRATRDDSVQAMREVLNTCADIETRTFKELLSIGG